MPLTDWLVVVLLNGGIIAYGLFLARGVRGSKDWFLAGKSLPFWLVGLSMYATAIDASDLIADSGGTYDLGFRYFVVAWVGTVLGWVLAAHWIFLPMYRAGMYTNAEYLEARYGPIARVVSVFVQVQFRTMVLAIIATSLFLMLKVVCGWEETTCWWMLGVVALLASVYTALGGLKSVAVTDTLQFIIMAAAALVLWSIVFGRVGGWDGLEQKLADADSNLPAQLLHAGTPLESRESVAGLTQKQIHDRLDLGGVFDAQTSEIVHLTPGWVVALGLIIAGLAYVIVNHTQAMRMLAARNERHFKLSASVASIAMIVFAFFNLSMGVLGRALHPDRAELAVKYDKASAAQDAIYPHLVTTIDTPLLQGLLVAGIFAAALSTFDSIGSTLSALVTRDFYARLLVRNRDDRHYLRVSQWLTPVIIGGSFIYIPFLLKGGMLKFYLELTSTFVVPLLTLYLLGALTPVHRKSAVVGLLAGATYGVMRLVAPTIATNHGVSILPAVMMDTYAAYGWSLAITASTMLIYSLVRGFEKRGELLHAEKGGWLATSQDEIRALTPGKETSRLAVLLSLLVLALGMILSFGVFW